MAYSVDVKNEVIERLKNQSAKEISEQMNISLSTIYKWKKEFINKEQNKSQTKENIESSVDTKKNDEKDIVEEITTSKEIKKLINVKKFDQALKLTEKYPYNPIIQSQRIGIFIRQKRYVEAKKLCQRPEFINEEKIQSQLITIYMQEGKLEKAKEIGQKPEFINDVTIQSQLITIYMQEGALEKAKEIGQRPELINDAPIQSQMITIYIREENFDEAEKIGQRPEFKNDQIIQNQLKNIRKIFEDPKENIESNVDTKKNEERDITGEIATSKNIKRLIKLKKFDTALKLTEKYPYDSVIQSQRIGIFIRQKRYIEAKEIGQRAEFINYAPIQSQLITIYMQAGDLEKAKEICQRPEFINNEPIQSQLITIYMQAGDLEKAKEIGQRSEFIDYEPIQSQMITIYIREGNFDEAERIGKRPEFRNNEIIQNQLKNIIKIFEEPKENIKVNQEFLNQIKTKLYYNRITKNDIKEIEKNSEISEFERICMLLAIYEKMNYINAAKQLIKKYKRENPDSEENKKLNIIMQRIESKKIKIFDFLFYNEILSWEIDDALKAQYEQQIQEENEEKKKAEKQIAAKPKSKVQKEDSIKITPKEEKPQKGVTKTRKKEKIFKDSIKVDIKPTISKKTETPNYFEQVLNYLKEKRTEIYFKANSTNFEIQRQGISQLDRMDILIDKVNDNKNNKEYLTSLYAKIQLLKEKEGTIR